MYLLTLIQVSIDPTVRYTVYWVMQAKYALTCCSKDCILCCSWCSCDVTASTASGRLLADPGGPSRLSAAPVVWQAEEILKKVDTVDRLVCWQKGTMWGRVEHREHAFTRVLFMAISRYWPISLVNNLSTINGNRDTTDKVTLLRAFTVLLCILPWKLDKVQCRHGHACSMYCGCSVFIFVPLTDGTLGKQPMSAINKGTHSGFDKY